MKKTALTAAVLCAALSLTGCGSILDRGYGFVQPHTRQYWEDSDASVLRAEDYQSLVNGLVVLAADRVEQGTMRLYHYEDQNSAMEDMERACAEVTVEDPVGAYVVDYVTYECTEGVNFYEMNLSLAYRRTKTQLQEMGNATGTGAVPELLRHALEDGRTELAVKVSYCDSTEEELKTMAADVMRDFGREEGDWELYLYPKTAEIGQLRIIELIWH